MKEVTITLSGITATYRNVSTRQALIMMQKTYFPSYNINGEYMPENVVKASSKPVIIIIN